jgi:acyl carrier protein
MDAEQVVRQIRDFVAENFLLGQDDKTFSDTDSFMERGIIDSTGVLQLVAFLQDTYEIAVEDDELSPDNLDTLASVAAYVCRKKREDGSSPALTQFAVAGGQS